MSLIDWQKKALFASILLPCHKSITWSAKVDLLTHPFPLISICDSVVTLMTDTYFRISLLSFCDCAYALFPHLISSSGVCRTLGRECRLLQPRFVVRSVTPQPTSLFAPAWSDERFSVRWRTACVYVTFCELFFFNGCKHEDCILLITPESIFIHPHEGLFDYLGVYWRILTF